jgi:tetratricopeptide (TPR) repeat protein
MMVRSIALVAVLSAMVATAADYAISRWTSGNFISGRFLAAWRAGPEPSPPKLVLGDERICAAMTSSVADGEGLDPDFATGARALGIGDWNAAITAFKLATLRDPRNADIENNIGNAYLRLRQWGPATQHFQQALMSNRRHRGAREHLGEMALIFGERKS